MSPVGFCRVRSSARWPRHNRKGYVMKERNVRLVLECVVFATAILKLVATILALLGTALNYPHGREVVYPL